MLFLGFELYLFLKGRLFFFKRNNLTKMETKACATPSFLSPTTGSKFHVFTFGSTEHPKCIVYTYVELYCSNTKNFSFNY